MPHWQEETLCPMRKSARVKLDEVVPSAIPHKEGGQKRASLLSMVMKKIILACAFLCFLSSCSEDKVQNNDRTDASDADAGSDISLENPQVDLEIGYDIEDEVLARPQFEAIEVSQTKITLNWFDPSGGSFEGENPSNFALP